MNSNENRFVGDDFFDLPRAMAASAMQGQSPLDARIGRLHFPLSHDPIVYGFLIRTSGVGIRFHLWFYRHIIVADKMMRKLKIA